MKSILNREFKYVPSAATDLAATFKRIRKEQKEAERARIAAEHERVLKVRVIGSAR